MTVQDPSVRIAALEAARAAVQDAASRLDRARTCADDVAGRTGWASPAATAFRDALAAWQGEAQSCRAALETLAADLARARARLTAGPWP